MVGPRVDHRELEALTLQLLHVPLVVEQVDAHVA